MPAIILLSSLFISLVAVPCSTTETREPLPADVHIVATETTSIMWVRVSRCCVARTGPHMDTLLETESSSQSTPVVYWDRLLRAILVVGAVFLSLTAIACITRDLRRVRLSQLDGGRSVPEVERNTLLGTRVSSSATLCDDYGACESIPTTVVHTPSPSLRGSRKPVLKLVTHCGPVSGEYGDYSEQATSYTSGVLRTDYHVFASPTESTRLLIEPLTMVVAQSIGNDTRGKKSAAVQKAASIGYNGVGQSINECQTDELIGRQCLEASKSQTQTLRASPNIGSRIHPNGPRAQTAPCTKTRSNTFLKSWTGLAALQQAMVHVLAVGVSWEGIGDGSRALPGPLHDVAWLCNVFAQQENFRFTSLLDHAATLVTIRRSLMDMLSVAGENDPLVLYFSGHGGPNDSFELYNSASLNEVTLNEWIVEFRSTTLRKSPVYIIFDFCRPDLVQPKTELASGVHVIWACSPTESALDLKLAGPGDHLPRSCFLLSLILAIDDVSEEPTAPVVQRFAKRMMEFVRAIRGIHCYKAKCRLSWRYCGCDICSQGNHCAHGTHDLPFQVVSIGGIEGSSDLPTIVKYIASRFPLHIKRVSERVSRDHWISYFNPSRISANKRPLNPRNQRLGMNVGIEADTVRNMTIPVNLIGI